MAVLVTGGAGYVGSHMALELVERGETVVILDDLSTGMRRLAPAGATFYLGDIGDEALLTHIFKTHGVRAIMHFAGSIVVPDSVKDPLGYYFNNTVKSRTLIAAAVEHGVKHFIFSSTAAVYGMPERVPITEDMPLLPISPYGNSKLMTEMMLRDTAVAFPMRFCALRYFNVAGADPAGRSGQASPRATHLIKIACETVIGKRPRMEVYGTDYPTSDGTCIRDYVHVSDLVSAHRCALDYLRQGGESIAMNCGYGHGFSVLEVIETVKRVSGVNFEVRMADRRPGDPAVLISSPDLIRKTLPWRPQFENLDIIVEHALRWERKLATFEEATPAAAE